MRLRKRRNSNAKRAAAAAGGATAAAIVAAVATRRRRSSQPREYDDVTLARKVESEIFRPDDAPKGTVNVNAESGVVFLRGVVKAPEQIKELEAAALAVDGVTAVNNLLHTSESATAAKV